MNDVFGVLPVAILVLAGAIVAGSDRLFRADIRASAWLASAIALSAGAAAAFAGTGDDALGGLLRRGGIGLLTSLVGRVAPRSRSKPSPYCVRDEVPLTMLIATAARCF